MEAATRFTANLDTPAEIAAYVGEAAAAKARLILKAITADPTTIPTDSKIAEAIQSLGDGAGASGGGGGSGGGGTLANQAPEAPTLSQSTIDEEKSGAEVGTVRAIDPNGDAVTFSVDDPRFEVVGGVLKLKAGQSVDFEGTEDGKIGLTLTASDGTLSTSAAVVLTVNDRPDPVKLSGTAVDGYIAGATVFADADKDGVLDQGEASTITDATGNFTLVGGTGPLVMFGGTDISTNTPFVGKMKAPEGSLVITPLTTLVEALVGTTPGQSGTPLTAAQAQAEVLEGLGLDPNLNLATFDPIAATLSTDPAQRSAGAAAITAAIQIQNTIVQASAVLEGAGATETSAGAAVTAALAQAVAGGTGGAPINNVSTLQTVLTSAATTSGANTQNVQAAATAIATAIASTNSAAQSAATANSSDPTALLTALAQVSIVAQGAAATAALTQAGSSGQTTQVTSQLNASAITAAIDALPDNAVGNVIGDNVAERKTGTPGPDLIEGNGGNDTLEGLGANDSLYGGTGTDSLLGGDGDDRLSGGAGPDLLDGGGNFDRAWYFDDAANGGIQGVVVNLSTAAVSAGMNGGTIAPNTARDGFGDIDTLVSVEEASGTMASDAFHGNDGSNYFFGYGGDDIAYGAAGGDGFQPGAGNDTFFGGADGDEISYSNWNGTSGIELDLRLAVASVDGPMMTFVDPWGGTDTFYAVEFLRGTKNIDTLTGDSANNRIRGLAGNDTLDGQGGNGDLVDYLRDVNVGGIGSVIVNLSDAPVTVGGITVAASSARDGFGDTDTLTGFERARGTDKNDSLFGSAGNNRLDGMGGADTLDGGAGFDEAFINLFDVIGGPLTSSVVNGEVFVRAGSVEVLKISQSAGVITTTGLGPAAFYGVDTLQNIEAVSISNDGSFLQVPVSLLTPINAGIDQNGNGFITGTAANDVLDVAIALPGFAGTSVSINGFAGDDYLRNGNANGPLNGGRGNDTLDGGAGTSDLADYSSDAAAGGTAGVIVNFSGASVTVGTVTLDPGRARDGFGDTDTLIAIEQVRGTQQADIFFGGDANGSFFGRDGDDTYFTAGGDDFVAASAGADTIDGGIGSDTIGFNLDSLGISGPLTVDALSAGGPYILANNIRILALAQSNGAIVITGLGPAAVFGIETVSNVERIHVQLDNSNAVNLNVPLTITTGVNQGTSFVNGSIFGETIDVAALLPGLAVGANVGVNAFLGSDSIIGGANGEFLDGGRGNDTIQAGGGDDNLVGNHGNDSLDGGAGTGDFVDYSLDAQNGGLGGVLVNLSAIAVQAGPNQGITVNPGTAIDGFGTNDVIANVERIRGTNASDGLFGDDQDNSFFGLDGNDLINAGGGNDFINAGKGSDFVDGGVGVDTVSIDLGELQIAGPLTSVTVGSEIIVRAGGEDVLRIAQSGPAVTIVGLNAAAAVGSDTVTGVEFGNIRNSGSNLQLRLQSNSGQDSNGNGFVDGTELGDVLNVSALGSTPPNFVVLRGFGGDDTIQGGAGRDLIEGGSGNDSLAGLGGANSLNGGRGNDTLDGGTDDGNGNGDAADYSRDALDGGLGGVLVNLSAAAIQNGTGPGATTVNAGQALDGFGDTDTLISIEEVRGSNSSDGLWGSAGNDIFTGNGGNDLFIAGGGNDFSAAGAGDDIFQGGTGFDTIGFNLQGLGFSGPLTPDSITYAYPVVRANGVEILKLEKSGGEIIVTGLGAAAPAFGTETLTDVESLFVSLDFNNSVTFATPLLLQVAQNGNVRTVEGTLFSETIEISALFQGLQAGERVSANGGLGRDTMIGALTDDILNGGRANDSLSGGPGNDYLVGDHGDDTITGGAGSDTAGWQLPTDTAGMLSLVDVNGTKFVRLTNGGNATDLFSVAASPTQATVTDLRDNAPYGTDTVDRDVEQLHFFVSGPNGQPAQLVIFDWL